VPARLARLAAGFAAAAYARTLGLAVVEVAPGRACLRLPYRPRNANRNGALHGGALASLITTAAALAAATVIPTRRRRATSTVDLAVHFLAPAIRVSLCAEATVRRRGRAIVFVDVELRAVTGESIARGLVARRIGRASRRRDRDQASLDEVPEEALRRARPSGSPFGIRLGIRTRVLARGRAVSLLPAQTRVADARGRVDEGALATLADSAAGAASWSIEGFDPGRTAATVALHLAYETGTGTEAVLALANASWRSDNVFASAVRLLGRRTARPLAAGSVTYRIARVAARGRRRRVQN
jgi:uncharacterized protein (TIGR00369 family)